MTLRQYIDDCIARVDEALIGYLDFSEIGENDLAHPLTRAMTYAMQGGKRLRPVLALAGAEAVGGRSEDAMPAACAVM